MTIKEILRNSHGYIWYNGKYAYQHNMDDDSYYRCAREYVGCRWLDSDGKQFDAWELWIPVEDR